MNISVNAPLTEAASPIHHRREIPALTGLRFLAAFLVAVAHGAAISLRIESPSPLFEALKHYLQTTAGFGMTLFFVLSGFVIHYNYQTLIRSKGGRGFVEFMWARFSRLYPLFIVLFVVDLLIGGRSYTSLAVDPVDTAATLLKVLPYYLTFTQSWFYKVIGEHNLVNEVGSAIPVTWSISTEWFFYLCYPAILLIVVRARKPLHVIALAVVWTVIWGTFASGFAAYGGYVDAWATAYFGPIASVKTIQESFVRWLFYFSPYLRIGEFILGCIAAQLYLALEGNKAGRRERDVALIAVSVAILSIPLLMYCMYGPADPLPWLRRLNNNYGLAPSIAVLLFCAARYDFSGLRWLSARPVIRLGEASYSIYLTHLLIFSLICGSQGPLSAGWTSTLLLYLRLVAMLAFVFLVSMGLYALVENPARRKLRELWQRPGSRLLPWSLAAAPIAAAALVIGLGHVMAYATAGAAPSGIQVQSATYGGNCGAADGNATRRVRAACNGRAECKYVVDVAILGDTAPGCGKDFVVSYVCSANATILRQELPGEAGLGGQSVSLTCETK